MEPKPMAREDRYTSMQTFPRRAVLRFALAALALVLGRTASSAFARARDEVVVIDGWVLLSSDLDPPPDDHRPG